MPTECELIFEPTLNQKKNPIVVHWIFKHILKIMKNHSILTGMFLLLLLWITPKLHGIELYSILQNNCQFKTGLIIGVDEQKIYMLDTHGGFSDLSRSGIEQILVYNTLDNPFDQIQLVSDLQSFARFVTVQGVEETSFSGWPIRFVENLIVFFDTEGKTHLVDVELIQGFKRAETLTGETKKIKQFKRYQFGFGNNLPECTRSPKAGFDLVQPTRMISDQIKISKFLQVYQKGFTKLGRFQKRTSFYARPYLYEKKTKVGIVVDREDYQEELPQLMPLNFQWPTGSNYGPQGILNLGLYVNELLPNVEPVFGLKFSGKYHFLSVFFAGNPWAFSYGADYIVEGRMRFQNFFKKRDPTGNLVFPQYNQIALTGFEWGPYSILGGYYYPIIGLQGNGFFRELLAEQSIPIASFKYTAANTRLQLTLADIRLQSNNPTDSQIKLIYASEMAQATALSASSTALIGQLDDFSLHSQMLRFNVDLDLNKEVQLGLSEVVFNGAYTETLQNQRYSLTYNQYITSARLQQEFGDYVALKIYLNYFIRQYHSQANSHDEKTGENKVSMAVVVEFIL